MNRGPLSPLPQLSAQEIATFDAAVAQHRRRMLHPADAELQPKRPESPEDLGERFHAKKERREMLSPQDPRRTQSIRDLEEPLAPPKTDREKWVRRRAIERRLEALERELLV